MHNLLHVLAHNGLPPAVSLSSWIQSKTILRIRFNIFLGLAPTVLDGALMPSMLPLVKREDVTPMEVISNLQSAGVFKVIYLSVMGVMNNLIRLKSFDITNYRNVQ